MKFTSMKRPNKYRSDKTNDANKVRRQNQSQDGRGRDKKRIDIWGKHLRKDVYA